MTQEEYNALEVGDALEVGAMLPAVSEAKSRMVITSKTHGGGHTVYRGVLTYQGITICQLKLSMRGGSLKWEQLK